MDSDEDLINILDNVSKSCTSAVRKKEKAEMSHGDNQLFSYDQSKKSNKSNSLLEDLLDEFTEPLNGDVKTTSSSGYSIPSYSSSANQSPIITSQSECKQSSCATPKLGGVSTEEEKTAKMGGCVRLHCVKCDNRVVSFAHKEWVEDSCDYLFFRNSYPDQQRLQKAWRQKKGWGAYCCQCNWISVNSLTLVSSVKDLKWICSKHC
ncbi:cilia- and flagella-associated protein 418-like [Symsagittifera roscoffensis]|uniref:cilia- and flagella-associated protein 418-like n=1 Tax=Symsagittifera roscoffensis TaxID=84072 RepID=UPI00307B65DB